MRPLFVRRSCGHVRERVILILERHDELHEAKEFAKITDLFLDLIAICQVDELVFSTSSSGVGVYVPRWYTMTYPNV